MSKQYKTFKEFYPFYLSQHQDLVCRRLHYLGSTIIVVLLINTFINQQWWQLVWLPVIGYGFAWIGHFMFEKNRPATFTYPLYSLLGDWVMYGQMLKRVLSKLIAKL
ncbi:Mpo1-like protein [Shewanella sp. HL-SH5]|uniref:Mpo1-like protein n=1 Tax=unclassified Shewanella TaxID=196818 RepID=UPI003EB7FFC5